MADRRPLRVLVALPQGTISPGPRYRVLQYLPYFEREGLACHVVVMQGERATRASITSEQTGRFRRVAHYGAAWIGTQLFMSRIATLARSYDRLLLYRLGVPGWLLPDFRPLRDRILFDFDDALSQPEARRDGLLAPVRRRLMTSGFVNALRVSGLAITSNRYNAEIARGFGARTAVVPTSVEVSRYAFRDRGVTSGAPVTIGWMGTPSTAPYLRLIETPLRRAVRRHGARLVLIGAGCNPFSTLDADVRPWSQATETDDIGGFDIGVMPMPDTAWTRGKAALKALQYGASGAPTVASWTSTNEEILARDQGTFLCRGDEEWETGLDTLLSNSTLRGALGRRARAHVESHYSIEENGPRVALLVRDPGSETG